MASNTRKRLADSDCSPVVLKALKSSEANVTPPIKERRRRAGLGSDVSSSMRDPHAHPTTQYQRGCYKFRLPTSASQSSSLHATLTTSETSTHPESNSSRQRTAPRSGLLHSQTHFIQPTACTPKIFHQPHPASKLCQDFHYVPYPLGLLPYDSWHKLHNREDIQPSLPFTCPVCRKDRKVTAHIRKLFLVGERLTWEEGLVSIHEKDLNEELNGKVNYELGILGPVVKGPEQMAGGKNSKMNKFHPYQNEHEMKLAFELMFMTENLSEVSWSLWIGTQLDLERMFGEYERLDAVPSTTESGTASHKRIVSYRSLRDFYILLDKIERTSYVGTLFLEAYAEKLRDDMCKDCWFKHNVKLDMF